MKYIKQLGIIIVISFISEILHTLIPLSLPASVYGIVLLFICLETRAIHISSIKETGYFLIEIMPLMFIPAAVGLIKTWAVIRPSWLAYVTITIVSTFAVMIISGKVTQGIIKYKKARGKSNE